MEENATPTELTTRSVGIRYGLILATISIVFFLDLFNDRRRHVLEGRSMGRYRNDHRGSIPAHKYFKDNGDGFMNFGQGVGIAFWCGLVSSVITSVFTYLFIKFFDNSMITAIRDQAIRRHGG
jgi:hypothetical protein